MDARDAQSATDPTEGSTLTVIESPVSPALGHEDVVVEEEEPPGRSPCSMSQRIAWFLGPGRAVVDLVPDEVDAVLVLEPLGAAIAGAVVHDDDRLRVTGILLRLESLDAPTRALRASQETMTAATPTPAGGPFSSSSMGFTLCSPR